MKRFVKKKLTLLLAMIMAGALFSGIPSFAEETGKTTVTMEAVSAQPGSEVKIPVCISGDQGVIGFDLLVTYPEVLSLTEVEKGELLTAAEAEAVLEPQDIQVNTPAEDAGYSLFSYAGEDNTAAEGCLFTLVFMAAENADGLQQVVLGPGTATGSEGGLYTVTPDNQIGVLAVDGSAENAYASAQVNVTLVIPVEKTALSESIDIAYAALENENTKVSADGMDVEPTQFWVSQETYSQLEAAVKAALLINAKEDATQEQVDEAKNALEEAYQRFTSEKLPGNKADRTGLTEAIEAARAVLNNTKRAENGETISTLQPWIAPDKWDAFAKTVEDAAAVLEDENASGTDILAAIEALQAEQLFFEKGQNAGSLEPTAENLAEIAEQAQAAAQADNVVVSKDGSDVDPNTVWVDQATADAFNETLKAAQEVLADPEADAQRISDAITALQDAQAAFERAKKAGSKETVLDANALRAAIETALLDLKNTRISANGSEIDPADLWVTQTEADALFNAIETALAVVTDPAAEQTAIDAQTAALVKAQGVFDQAKKAGTKKAVQTVTKTALTAKMVKVAKTSVVYTGKALKPSVTVKNGTKTLKKGTDYSVSYKTNKNVGTATVTVTGKGAYQGTVKKTFKILPKATKMSTKPVAAKKGFTVKWKKVTKQVTGYQIQYSTSKKFASKKTITVKGAKKSQKKITKLKAKKTYYVRIRTYKTVKGKKYYSKWSAVKKVKTK